MRLLLAASCLLLSCATPRAYSYRAQNSPETAYCVQQCGHLRNECADAHRFFFGLIFGYIYEENMCTAQFDHCVSVCPGVKVYGSTVSIPEVNPVQ